MQAERQRRSLPERAVTRARAHDGANGTVRALGVFTLASWARGQLALRVVLLDAVNLNHFYWGSAVFFEVIWFECLEECVGHRRWKPVAFVASVIARQDD